MEDEHTEVPDIEDVSQAEIDDANEYADHQQEVQDDAQFGNEPWNHASQKESIWSFFNNILKLKNSSKVANLDRRELGMLDLSVRNCQHLAGLGTLLHNKSYESFFMNKGEITLATSMSKKGWLPELVVSQKKFTQRSVQPMALQSSKKGFLGLGGGKTEQPQPQ